jgi:exopolysaccharide biosynthesis polyprenyl glycosylphosphotransferase
MSFRLSPAGSQKLNVTGDLLILAGACFLAAIQGSQVHWRIALAMTATASFFWLCASRVLRQYDTHSGRGLLGDIELTVLLMVAVLVPMAMLRYVSPRYAMVTEWVRLLAALPVPILALRLVAVGFRLWRDRPVAQLLIVGISPLGRLTQREIGDGRGRRAVIGHLRFADEQDDGRLQVPILGTIDDLERLLRDRVVDEIYFASSSHSQRPAVQEAIQTCERCGVPFALPACGYRLHRARPVHASAIPDGYVHYRSVRHKPLQREVKRLFDIVASAAAIVLLSPLLLVAAVAVKVTSKGPIFFRQERVSLHGRTFSMLKFRSMVVDAEQLKAQLWAHNEQSGPVFKMTNDPRITPVGRLLRKYSIDELPQLVNVLRGDMSIVGPRPAVPSEVARYEAWQRRRTSVRPGLTCIWQVSGRNRISFATWMMLDMNYIDHWDLWEDFRLVWRTVPVVLLGRDAS